MENWWGRFNGWKEEERELDLEEGIRKGGEGELGRGELVLNFEKFWASGLVLLGFWAWCNISLVRTPDVTYSLRTLVCKWFGSLYDWLFRLWIMMMLSIWWYIFDFTCVDRCYWLVSCECEWLWTDWGCWWHRWTSLDSGSSKGVDCLWFVYFCYCICDIWLIYYDVVYGLLPCLLMDAGFWYLSNETRIWNKRVMHDNQRYWGRGVA